MPKRSFWKRRRDLTRTSGPTWQIPLGDPRFTGTTATSPTGIDVVQSSSPSVTEYYIFECPHLSGDSCPSSAGVTLGVWWVRASLLTEILEISPQSVVLIRDSAPSRSLGAIFNQHF